MLVLQMALMFPWHVAFRRNVRILRRNDAQSMSSFLFFFVFVPHKQQFNG